MTKSQNLKQLSIAHDFSREPLGRVYADSDSSGQLFREKLLAPALQKHDVVVVSLDGTEGYGSSFLEEAFGGLVRHHGFKAEDVQRLKFISNEDDSLISEIAGYISDALRVAGDKPA
jgi:hypothetical protein